MQPTNLPMRRRDWLGKAGFRANPFGEWHVVAGKELRLPDYFVAPSIWDRLIDADMLMTSAIAHAQRGAGKSALCRMFAAHCRDQYSRMLVAEVADWRQISAARDKPEYEAALPHCSVIAAVVNTNLQVANHPPFPSIDQWRTWAQVGDALDFLTQLAAHVVECGYTACYVLFDGVDDNLDENANWPAEAANLLAPLISKLPLHTIDRLVLRYFLPTEAIEMLRYRARIRDDLLDIFPLVWSSSELKELLHERLRCFSDGQIHTLNQLVEAQASKPSDIDEFLITKANGNPRALLRIANAFIDHAVKSATSGRWQLTRQDVETFYRQKIDTPQRRPRRQRPLDLENQEALLQELSDYLLEPPASSWLTKLDGIMADLSADAQRRVPSYSSMSLRDAALRMLQALNSFEYLATSEPRDHPLMILLLLLRRRHAAARLEVLNTIEGHAWAALTEEWDQRMPPSSA